LFVDGKASGVFPFSEEVRTKKKEYDEEEQDEEEKDDQNEDDQDEEDEDTEGYSE
jgi:hypothetical protein